MVTAMPQDIFPTIGKMDRPFKAKQINRVSQVLCGGLRHRRPAAVLCSCSMCVVRNTVVYTPHGFDSIE